MWNDSMTVLCEKLIATKKFQAFFEPKYFIDYLELVLYKLLASCSTSMLENFPLLVICDDIVSMAATVQICSASLL